MGFLDKLFGRGGAQQGQPQQQYAPQPGYAPQAGTPQGQPQASDDERAIARYRYLLRTAPPEQVEQAHAEAFAQLTPEQRQQVLTQLGQDLPEAERPRTDDPRDLARAATRAEYRQPGYMERSFAGGGGRGGMGGIGMGGLIAGSLFSTIAGVVIGSAIADAMFDDEGYAESPEAQEAGDAGGDPGAGAGDGGSFDGADQAGAENFGDGGGSFGDGGSSFGDAGGGADFGGGFDGGGFDAGGF